MSCSVRAEEDTRLTFNYYITVGCLIGRAKHTFSPSRSCRHFMASVSKSVWSQQFSFISLLNVFSNLHFISTFSMNTHEFISHVKISSTFSYMVKWLSEHLLIAYNSVFSFFIFLFLLSQFIVLRTKCTVLVSQQHLCLQVRHTLIQQTRHTYYRSNYGNRRTISTIQLR